MLGLVLAAALLTTATAAAVPAGDDDIVVVAERIKQVSLALGRDDAGRNTCDLSRSSGDTRIDRAICKRAASCLGRGAVVPAVVEACVDRQKRKLAADWARGARS